MRKRISNILWGLIFIAVGIGIAGSMAGLWEFRVLFAGWWTLFIIIPAFISIIEKGFRVFNTLSLFIGGAMFACCQGWMAWGLLSKLLVPAVFVVIGLVIVVQNIFHMGGQKVSVPNSKRSEESVVFSGKKLIVDNEFYGMDCDAVFGGLTLDLRHAVINQNISIDAMAVFGGIDIFLPTNVIVKMNDTSLFGGCSNACPSRAAEEVPIVYINATAMFGGVEVR